MLFIGGRFSKPVGKQMIGIDASLTNFIKSESIDSVNNTVIRANHWFSRRTSEWNLILGFNAFVDIMEKEGLQPMKAVGETFDPEMHDALMQSEEKKAESGSILSEYSKGYLLNGKVIRHAQVIVAK